MRKADQKPATKDVVERTEERAVQRALPMAEVLTSIEQGLGGLVRKVGRMFIESVLEAEVEQMRERGRAACKADRRIAGEWSKVRV